MVPASLFVVAIVPNDAETALWSMVHKVSFNQISAFYKDIILIYTSALFSVFICFNAFNPSKCFKSCLIHNLF